MHANFLLPCNADATSNFFLQSGHTVKLGIKNRLCLGRSYCFHGNISRISKMRINRNLNMASQESNLSGRRTISVRAFGEASCPPDIMQFTVTVSSSKDTLEAAHASVKRRTDYILQALEKNGIKRKTIACSTQVNRIGHCRGTIPDEAAGEVSAGDGFPSVQTDILVQAGSLSKSEGARNLLLQKLDHSVRFTPLVYLHTAENKQGKR